jgi:hypothetical protein
MAGNYTVKQGDHVAAIAQQFGFSDYNTIWNDPNNADLKAKRNPNVLFPGDVIYIPDRDQKVESRSTDQKHQFVKKSTTLKLRLVLEDAYEMPIANAACTLVLGSETRNVTTDGQGKIDEVIPPFTQNAVLLIKDSQTAVVYDQINIKIGNLDPVEELSGQQARLSNLGYFWGKVGSPADDDFNSAVQEFQCDNPPLTVDGVCGPQTQTQLKKAHGS